MFSFSFGDMKSEAVPVAPVLIDTTVMIKNPEIVDTGKEDAQIVSGQLGRRLWW
ncbi:MAG: hypothetical protein IPI62_01160 [Bacteroidetes bacterium]|nr:hypothetical protein [Bacteroidota bacterium]